MQLFLLKITLCYLLFINVTYCTRCRNLLCKASCYYKNNGFDYGYCNEKNSCICVTPEIYLFDGLQNYSDINDSLSNDNLIQNLIWKKKLLEISKNCPHFKENLNSLKSAIFQNCSSDKNFINLFLNNPLENVLDEIKIKKLKYITKKCDEFLKYLSGNTSNVVKLTDFNNENKKTSSIGINVSKKSLSDISKSNINQTNMDKNKHKILIELSEETIEYDESDEEYSSEQNKKNVPEKTQIQNENNYRNVVKLLPQINDGRNLNKLTQKNKI